MRYISPAREAQASLVGRARAGRTATAPVQGQVGATAQVHHKGPMEKEHMAPIKPMSSQRALHKKAHRRMRMEKTTRGRQEGHVLT